MASLDFQDLIRKRKEWLVTTQENEFDFDILLAGMYHNPSHFIFEILQNAEDVAATYVQFKLFPDRLEIIHDGRDFTPKDVEAITGIGNTTKNEDLTAIGEFGVGFKSVFAITQSPAIHSGPYHFEITDFVVPSLLPDAETNTGTRFIFPFNRKERSPDDTSNLIAEKLKKLEPQTLLFLENIEEIKWETPSSHGHYLKSSKSVDGCDLEVTRVEVVAQANGSDTFQEFLVFSRPLELEKPNLRIEVAYQISAQKKDEAPKVIPFDDSRLVVFFPTEKPTYLKFLVHGPYKTTPNRENVPPEDPQNQYITDEIAILVADSLLQIRKLGFLDVDFLQILPLDSSLNAPIYSSIFEAVKNRLSDGENLLPTEDGKYTSASNALLARVKDLTDLFSNYDIEFLFHRSRWLDTQITIDRTPELRRYLLYQLKIREIRLEDIASEFTTEFFNTKDDGWMARFYTRLNDTPALWRESYRRSDGILRHQPIIRLQDDTHICPFDSEGRVQVYLPTSTKSHFPTVKTCLVDDPNVRGFLESLGLTPPDLYAEIREFILPKYSSDQPDVQDAEYFSDLQKIITALSSGKTSRQDQLISDLETTFFIKTVNTTTGTISYSTPQVAYRHRDYLKEYFIEYENAWLVSEDVYDHFGYEKFEAFLSRIGVPEIPRRKSIKSSLSWEDKYNLRNGDTFTAEYTPSDYQLDGLENFFNHLVTFERSLILWEILKRHIDQLGSYDADTFFEGVYSWKYYTIHKARFPTQFLKLLRSIAWLYDQSGELKKPCEVMLSQLDEAYDVDFKNIDVLKTQLDFRSDLIEQLPRDLQEKLILTEGISLEKLKEIIAIHLSPNGDDTDTTQESEKDSLGSEVVESLPSESASPVDQPIAGNEIDDVDEDREMEIDVQGISTSEGTSSSIDSTAPQKPIKGSDPPRQPTKPRKRQTKRLLSYVYPDESFDKDISKTKQSTRRNEIGQAGVDLVMEYERTQGRSPRDMETVQTHHPGYDITSIDPNDSQSTRYIEVKSKTGIWDSQNPIFLTKTEFENAEEYKTNYWLYIVEQVESDSPILYCIQDPANKADYFVYDHVWEKIAETVGDIKNE